MRGRALLTAAVALPIAAVTLVVAVIAGTGLATLRGAARPTASPNVAVPAVPTASASPVASPSGPPWQVLRNDFFEIAHPPGWHVDGSSVGAMVTITSFDPKKGPFPVPPTELRVDVAAYPNDTTRSISEYVDELERAGGDKDEILSRQTATLDRHPAVKLLTRGSGLTNHPPWTTARYYVMSPDRAWVFAISARPADSSRIALLDPMLASFRMIATAAQRARSPSPSPTPVPVGYTSDRFGYKVAYPAGATWRRSDLLSLVVNDPAALQQGHDLFTVRSEADERANLGTGTGGPAWWWALLVGVERNPQRMTARQWVEAGRAGSAVGQKVEDSSVGGLPALHVTNGARFNNAYYVARGDEMFTVAFHVQGTAPAGVTERDLELMIASLTFTRGVEQGINGSLMRVALGRNVYSLVPPSSTGSAVWRNFQPVQTDTGLIASVRVRVEIGDAWPADVTVNGVWVLGPTPWGSRPAEVRVISPIEREVVVRGGPKWDVGTPVQVVVNLIRQAGVEVGAVDVRATGFKVEAAY